MKKIQDEAPVIQELFDTLGELNQGDLAQLKEDLASLAKLHDIDLKCVDLESLRKLISLYTQNVMEDSASQ